MWCLNHDLVIAQAVKQFIVDTMHFPMWGTILISQLILLPVLIILGWIYIRIGPKSTGVRGMAVFDATILIIAVAVSAAGLAWIGSADIGNGTRIWKPILSILSTFHIFPLILGLGWWLRRRIFSATRRTVASG